MSTYELYMWWVAFIKSFSSFFYTAFVEIEEVIELYWEALFEFPIYIPDGFLFFDMSIADLIIEYLPLIIVLTVVAYIVRIVVDITT